MTATSTFHVTADRYADWRHVASGGSAEVWRVLDRDLGVELAIKLLRPELTSDSRQIDAMRREVLISRALRHPNICPIHDLYEGPRGIGIVMDLQFLSDDALNNRIYASGKSKDLYAPNYDAFLWDWDVSGTTPTPIMEVLPARHAQRAGTSSMISARVGVSGRPGQWRWRPGPRRGGRGSPRRPEPGRWSGSRRRPRP